MKKRIGSLLLALCVCAGWLCPAARAAGPAPVGADFTQGDGTEALAVLTGGESSRAAWDAGTKTLTLSGVDYTTDALAAVKLPDGAAIVLADGTQNKISGRVLSVQSDRVSASDETLYACGILCEGALRIAGEDEGSGKLTVTAPDLTIDGTREPYSVGIYTKGALEVTGGSVQAQGGTARVERDTLAFSMGICLDGSKKTDGLRVTGGSLTGVGGASCALGEDGVSYEDKFSYGVRVYAGNVDITGGSLAAVILDGEKDKTYVLRSGLYIYRGDLTITDGAFRCNSVQSLWLDGNVTQTGGSFEAEGETAVRFATYRYGGGHSWGNMTLTGGTTRLAGDVSIYNNGAFTVDGGTVEAEGIDGFKTLAVRSGSLHALGRIFCDEAEVTGGTLESTVPGDDRDWWVPFGQNLFCGTLQVSGGTLKAALDWSAGEGTLGEKRSLVRAKDKAEFTGGTVILDAGCAGGTAIQVRCQGEKIGEDEWGYPVYDYPEKPIESALTLTGAEEAFVSGTTGVLTQKYADTPVVFSDITPEPVALIDVEAADKDYDGTTAASLTGGSLTGAAPGADVYADLDGVQAAFADKNAKQDKAVSVTGGSLALRGKDAWRYVLTTGIGDLTGLTADIRPCTRVTDATRTSQRSYVGAGSFEEAVFTGVIVDGAAERAGGTVAYTLNGETKTPEEIRGHIKTLDAGSTEAIDYVFTGADNYLGASARGRIAISVVRASGGFSGPASCAVIVKPTENGSVTAGPARAGRGESITLTAAAASGYRLKSITASSGGRLVELRDLGGGVYSFTMPAGEVAVEAAFEKIPAGFDDVAEESWYRDAVLWAAARGIAAGTGGGNFSPAGLCTRAEIVTFLWRAAGSPAPADGACPFDDVAADSFAYDAVRWAAQQGIAKGVTERTFDPSRTCTRAEITAFLWRSQGAPEGAAAAGFADVSAGTWYEAAVNWAAETGAAQGTGGGSFSPARACTRAEIVTFLWRCMGK